MLDYNSCSESGLQYDITFNPKKSDVMIVKTKEDQKQNFPSLFLADQVLNVGSTGKYLGQEGSMC